MWAWWDRFPKKLVVFFIGAPGPMGSSTGVMGIMGVPGTAGPAGPAGQMGTSGGAAAHDLLTKVLPFRGSIIDIECDFAGGATGRGTGTKTTNGLIVTAFHVVDGCTAVAFVAEGVQVGAGGNYYQPVAGRDLAVIQNIGWTTSGAALAGVPGVVGAHPSIGDAMLLVSYPALITNDLQFTAANVSDDDIVPSLASELQTFWSDAYGVDVAAAHGSSGAPVFSPAGLWVGILVGGLDGPPPFTEYFLKVVIPIRYQ